MLQYLSKKGRELVAILRDYFVKTKSQTHRDCIIAKFANSVNTYAHMYSHCSCAHFMNFANVSTGIARMLREHTLLASLHEVFTCVSLPFFDKYRSFCWKLCASSYLHHWHHGSAGHRGDCTMHTGFPVNHVVSYTAYYWYKPLTYLSK